MARSSDSQPTSPAEGHRRPEGGRSQSQRLGDFEIVREIGRGGMGVVYEAIQLSLNRPVALKVLPPGTTPEQRDIERFQREAQAAAALDHPNIVPIYAQGEEEGTYYYAMRLVPGRALGKVIRDVRGMDLEALRLTDLGRSIAADSRVTSALAQAPTERMPALPPAHRPTEPKPTSPAEGLRRPEGGRSKTYLSLAYFRTAARLVLEVAEALEYAHSQGVIHRDVKPQNLILTPEGHLVITDFGLARFLSAPSITMSGEMMGTLAYMSPEQVRAEQQRIDCRTDVYSLGVTLYEVLALELPFRADTREAMLREILLEDPPPLRRLNPRIPKDLETICQKAIEKDPSRRYQSAKGFADDLYRFLEGLPIAARPVGVMGRLYRRALRRKALTAALAAALLTLVGGTYLGVQWYRAQQAKEAEEAAKLDEQRWGLLADARSLMEATSYGTALGRLKDAARIRHDHATQLSFWLLWDSWSDRATMTWKHTVSMSSIAFRPDGRTLAGGCKDGTVRLWDVTMNEEVGSPASSGGSLSGHGDWVTSVAFSPDGRTVASGSRDSRIRLWDVVTREELRTLAGDTAGVASVAFSPDGAMLVSGGADDTVRLWEVSTGRTVSALTGHTDDVTSVAFSPGGRTVASASLDGVTKLWDQAAGREVRTLAGHAGGVNSVAFSPDGRTLASGSADNTARLWDVESGQQLRELRGHQLEVNSVAFSPDGATVASASLDRTVRLWDADTGGLPRTLAGHTGSVVSVAFSPDGMSVVSTSADRTTRLWEAVTGRARLVEGHGGSVYSVEVSPDGRTLASASEDGTVRLRDLGTGRELHVLAAHTDRVMSVAFTPDGLTLASGSGDKTIRLWDVATGVELGTLTGHVGGVSSLAFSPDGAALVSGSLEEGARLWDVAGRREIPVLGTYVGVYAVAFRPDGTALALEGQHKTLDVGDVTTILKVWDVTTGAERCTFSGHTDSVWSAAFSPSGTIVASGGGDQTIRLWEVDGEKGPLTLTGHTGPVFPILFSPDGKFLVSGSLDRTLKLWDVATGRQIGTIPRPPGYRRPLAFSPDGRLLVCTAGADILIYDLHAYDEDTQRWLRSVSSHVGCAGPRAQSTTERCCWLGSSLLSAPMSRQQALRVAPVPCLSWRPSHVTRHFARHQVDAASPEDRGAAPVAQVLFRHRGPTAYTGGIVNPVLVGDPPFLVQPSPVGGRRNELKRELHCLALPWLVLGLTPPSMKSWI